jgi:hypothetical protein
MTATPHRAFTFLVRLLFVALAATALAGVAVSAERAARISPAAPIDDRDGDLEGRDEREPATHNPTVQAAFDAQSYPAGAVARLVLFARARNVGIQLYRVGAMRGRLVEQDRMRGTPVGPAIHVRSVAPGMTVRIALPRNWPSALYYAELSAPVRRVGYAPFVLAPARFGMHRIALVLPTQTWQAYNYRDDDGNGSSDTWYAGVIHTARLCRPFENRGVPPHYRYYDEPFIRWLAINDIAVDVLSDAELNAVSGDVLARSYELMIFSGHHEYVTTHEYDSVVRFRDLGGNLMFLSANNFFWKITIADGVMTRVARWRDLGRPEAALIGVQYYANDQGEHRGGWTLRRAPAANWIFARTGLEPGDLFSNGGIEADEVEAASPRNVQVLGEIRNLFDDGHNAQMTYYTTPRGAKVFAAGAFTLACSVWQPPVRQVMSNLITVLSEP